MKYYYYSPAISKSNLLVSFFALSSFTTTTITTVDAFAFGTTPKIPLSSGGLVVGGCESSSFSSRVCRSAARLDLPSGPQSSREEEEDDISNNLKKATATKYAWDKEPPKRSLEAVGKTHTANPLILNLVEASHWSLFVPSFAASWAVTTHLNTWMTFFEGDAFRATLWLLAPMVQAFAGLPPMVAHIYEDWQVSPSVEPGGSQNQPDCDPEVYTNERLRRVANLLLMSGLGVTALIQSYAYHGADAPLDLLSAGLLAYAVLGDKNKLVSNYVSPFFNQNKPTEEATDITVLPFPVSTLVFFVYSQILVLATTIVPLVQQVNDGNLPLQLAIVLPQLLAMIGGYLEGGVTEAKFDQRVHIGAVGTFFSGFALTAWSLYQLGAGQYLLA